MPTDRNQKQQQRQRRACFSVLSLTLLCMLALSNIERFGNSKQRSGRRKKAEDGFVCGRARVRHVRFPAKKMRRCTSEHAVGYFHDGSESFPKERYLFHQPLPQKRNDTERVVWQAVGDVSRIWHGLNNNTTTFRRYGFVWWSLLQWMHRTFVRHARRFGHTRVHTA